MRSKSDGALNLRQALALLIQNQAKFVAVELEAAHRFARIERDLQEIKGRLGELTDVIRRHDRMLSDLPEAIRQKIGFKPK